ncbi:MAG: cyclic nucleotide-binding domain-containing protein [Acidobacteria bacterium]|nr:cyclic nucleotide-binding domain-containing protein [Acidobacteriota bacterium]MCZ6877702.1 cyclic nucleotide-binding domain-containing protein [Acidobacteriota bacterium]
MPELKTLLSKFKLHSTSLLRGVDLESIQDLLECCPIKELKEGDVLISAGQPHHHLYLLLSGSLRIHLKRLTLDPIAILEPGEMAGEMSLIDLQPPSAYVVAQQDCRLLVLEEKTMWDLVDAYPIVARNLLFVLSQRLRQANALLEVSLLERVSEQELVEFHPREAQESKGLLEVNIEGEAVSLYQTATAYVLDMLRGAQDQQCPDLNQGEKLVKRMRDSISESSALLLLATDRVQEFAVSTHSVNVAILSLRVAQALKITVQDQIRVGIAALLHEIGVTCLPEGMLYRAGRLVPEVRKRPVYGAEILGEFYPDLDWLVKTVEQVFERENGSGFPQGLKGKEIREEAKILGIVDVFEACIHDRPYRDALTGYQLLEELTQGQTKSFADHIVKALLKSFSSYPLNEYVVLNTGEVAQVLEVNPEFSSRPLVKILFDKEGRPLKKPRESDLAHQPLLFIVKAISHHELPPGR